MDTDNTPATYAGRKYRDVTKEFARRYPQGWAKLNAKNYQLIRNFRVSNYFSNNLYRAEGEELCKCGIERAANSPEKLRDYLYYCGKMYSCTRCANLVAKYRAEQWMEASHKFSRKAKSGSELMFSSFVISPDTHKIPGDVANVYRTQLRLLSNFMNALGTYHQDHNLEWFKKEGKQRRSTKKEKRKQLLGPTVGSIHILPFQEAADGYANAHLHLGVVMVSGGSKTLLKNKIIEIFDREKLKMKLDYTPRQPEVVVMRRSQIYRNPRQIPEHVRQSPWGQFWASPDREKESQYIEAMRAFTYLSRPFKEMWRSESIGEARNMLQGVGMRPRQLHRSFGMMGVVRKELPHEPPAETNPLFRARFDAKNARWFVYRQIVDTSNF